MRADVLAIGTELLLGQIVDTNSSLDRRAARRGRHRHDGAPQGRRQPAAGWSRRCARCSRRPTRSSCAAGSGPTQDDVTREAIAEVHGRRARTARGARRAHRVAVRHPRPRHAGEQPAPGRRAAAARTRSRTRSAPRRASGPSSTARSSTRCPGVPYEMQLMVTRARAPGPARPVRRGGGHREPLAQDVGRSRSPGSPR